MKNSFYKKSVQILVLCNNCDYFSAAIHRYMIKYLKLPFAFDVNKLQEETSQLLSEKWALHYNSRDFEGDWEALPLRSVNGDINNILALDGNNNFADTPFMAHVPYTRQVIDHIQCPKMSVRLLNLKKGAVVHAHSDHDLYYEEGEVRLHIPVFTNEMIEFYLDEERVMMKEGECWYLNLAMMHRLHNKSASDRVHLVIDCKVNDWLKEQFNGSAVMIRKEVPDFAKPNQDAATQKNIIEQLRSLNTESASKIADDMEAALM